MSSMISSKNWRRNKSYLTLDNSWLFSTMLNKPMNIGNYFNCIYIIEPLVDNEPENKLKLSQILFIADK